MLKKQKALFGNKSGMTLVEVLVAITILMLVLFCVTPLFVTNLNTIKLSGDKAVTIYKNAGIMQKVLGNIETGDENSNVGYDVDVVNVPLSLNGNGKTYSVSAQGDLVASSPADLQQGFATLVSDAPNSNFQVFPRSLTDDFKEAYLTVAAIGFRFVDDPGSSVYELYCSKNGVSTKLKYGEDYTMRRVQSSDPEVQNRVMQIVLYGGTDVNFSNSPLTFKYKGYSKDIQVDAPSMIMVGEKSTDGYRYYVSRGETEKDSNGDDRLIVLEREMHDVPLTSAMNDVEWVPAESADEHAGYDKNGNGKIEDDEKYGYYVMCGDNGQIRRFWQNPSTGNYYWGGDYTYYTDAKFDKVNSSYFVNGTNTYSTDVSYKFSFRANAGSNGKGFNLSTNKSNYLQSVNIWSITAFGDNTNGRVSAFWGSDGRMFYYQSNTGGLLPPAYLIIKDGSYQANSGDRMVNGQQSQTWLNGSKDNYYELTGADTNANPITLTCVDAIDLSGKSVGAGDGYYLDVAKGGESYLSNWGCDPNVDYPTTSYTLYCGYIPASMDLWTTKSSPNGNFSESMAKTDDGTYTDVSTLYLDRVSNSIKDSAIYPMWKGTLGITPYLTRTNPLTKEYTLEVQSTGQRVYYVKHTSWKYDYEYLNYYPYENLNYALTGKFYDGSIFEKDDKEKLLSDVAKNISTLVSPANLSYSAINGKQQYMTNGKVVDITMAYLSHPYAIHAGANPTDDRVYDMSNDKGNKIFYWNNMRETITFLDCASTVIPSGEVDIPVSLMVGYVMGGMAEFDGDNIYVNSIMNNGIVFLRAGAAEHGIQSSDNSKTEEYYAKDKTGYKLNSESNVFHQFYYLNSRNPASDGNEPFRDDVDVIKHIGNLYGAKYWQNNRHIDYISMNGGKPDSNNHSSTPSGNYNYVRCHPMTDCKVTCVAWGTTWNNYPEAMWGTDNGTVLSWWVDLNAEDLDSNSSAHNDRSVEAEFQSYQWIDNVEGKAFKTKSYSWKGTVGVHTKDDADKPNPVSYPYSTDSKTINAVFRTFFDKATQENKFYEQGYGFISTLSSINDIEYANDYWVAVGNQATGNKNLRDKEISPALYCGNNSLPNSGSVYYGGSTDVKAYTGNGQGGSWVNVRYWYDMKSTGKQSEDNAVYLWKAVKISNNPNYNIVQINCLNGVWYATGYEDADKDGEWDPGEKAVVCWATDPLAACDAKDGHTNPVAGRWSENVQFYRTTGKGQYTAMPATDVGGINSVACRDDM